MLKTRVRRYRSKLRALCTIALVACAPTAPVNVNAPEVPANAESEARARTPLPAIKKPYPATFAILSDTELATLTKEAEARSLGWSIVLDPFGMHVVQRQVRRSAHHH